MYNNQSSHSANSALLTIRQACTEMQVGRTQLYGLCKAGTIRSVKVGKRGIRIPRSEIERFIREALT